MSANLDSLLQECLKSLCVRKKIVNGMEDKKVNLGRGWFYTQSDLYDWVINTNKNALTVPFRFDRKDYETFEVGMNHLVVKCRKTGKLQEVVSWRGMKWGFVKYTTVEAVQGVHDYPAVVTHYFDEYGDVKTKTIRTHFFVKAMTEGKKVLLAMGQERVLETHHKNKNKKDNSDENTVLLLKDEHKRLPKHLK